ncbi:DUF6597 domain-containing transcriptional factor, partial [Chloroflexota bacterium]
MFYEEYAPKSFLFDYLECYWGIQGFVRKEETEITSIFPDGCVDIIINLGDPMYRLGVAKNLLPSKYVVGAMSKPIAVELTGKVKIVGMRFKPGGAYPFLETPIKKLTDKTIDLFSVSEILAEKLASDRLSECLHNLAFSVLENSVAECVSNSLNIDEIIKEAVSVIRVNEGNMPISNLVRYLDCNKRTLEREFLKYVGLTSKFFSRVTRVQNAIKIIRGITKTEYVSMAYDLGYFD